MALVTVLLKLALRLLPLAKVVYKYDSYGL